MAKQTIDCPKCDGAGFIRAFGHVANGVCFCCKGNKTIEVDVVELKAKLSAYAIKTADWIMKSTAETYEGWSYDRLNNARNFCHVGDGLQQAYPELLSHWREVGDPAFFAAQEERLAEFYANR